LCQNEAIGERALSGESTLAQAKVVGSLHVKPEVHSAAMRGYGRAADIYARARPSYPDAAVDWLLAELGEPSTVVEVGAGTGKFTAQLVERGVTVLAVEPVAAMRERLATLGPLVTPLDATAENLPLETGSVDCLVAAQSLHWADVSAALSEFNRVLRAAGAVALIWNFRDIAVPWQRDLDALLSELRGRAPHSRDGRWERAVEISAFEATPSGTWRWSVPTDEAGVIGRVRSVSYVAAMPEGEQRRVDERIIDLLRQHSLNSSGRPIEFPYVTEAYVLRRRSAMTH
jgi:SAM-dependent methyltransferase